MKWLKHDTNARNDVKLKILRAKFGAEGYGVYFMMLEIVGEYISSDNIEEWGFVDKFHSMETLAMESGVSPDRLRQILKLCNELDLFQKKNERLFCRQIISRLAEYENKLLLNSKIIKAKSGEGGENIPTKSRQTSDNVHSDKIRIDKNRSRTDKIRNIGKAQKKDTISPKPAMSSVGDVLARKSVQVSQNSGITKDWQEKAFREMEYIGIQLENKDKGRVLKIYKEEAEGKAHKAQTTRVISYLKDYPTPLSYDGKLKMFFKLISNGFTPFD